MKKSVLATAVGIIGITLASCTVEVKDSTPDTTRDTTEDTTYVSPASTDDAAFLVTVYEMYPHLEYQWGDDFLIELGKTICRAIDEGMTFYDLVGIIVDAGADAEQVGYIAGAAIGVYCIWNEWFVNSASGF